MDSLSDLLRFVRNHSEFYKNLYSHLSDDIKNISELPILDSQKFWAENRKFNSSVYTSTPKGIAFRSGGTTGNPKFSVYTYQEMEAIAKVVGPTLKLANLQDGDRVALCLAVGDLNASFLFYNECFKQCGSDVFVLPLGNSVPLGTIWKHIIENKLNVVFGMPTFLTSLFSYYNQSSLDYQGINKIFFSGEHMLPHNLDIIRQRNPQIAAASAGHTSVDVGLMGYAKSGVFNGEHHSFDQALLEIVDLETDEVISEVHRPGKLLCTNLLRRLMPVIRYPVGDVCEWLDPVGAPHRRYKLHKRTPEAWSLAAASYQFSDVEDILNPFMQEMGILAYQIKITNLEGRDKLTVCLATSHPTNPRQKEFSSTLVDSFIQGLPHLSLYIKNIWPIEILWLGLEDLKKNERTGKLKRVIDDRA